MPPLTWREPNMTHESFAIGSAADWFAGLASFAVVVAAVFQDRIRHALLPPNLTPELHPARPDCQMMPLHVPGEPIYTTADALVMRLRVRNRGRAAATNVSVFVARLQELRDGKWKDCPWFLQQFLRWSHAPIDDAIVLRRLPRRAWHHCDLGTIVDPQQYQRFIQRELKENFGKNILHLSTQVTPTDQSNTLIPGRYRLDLELRCDEVDPTVSSIDVTVPQTWSPDLQSLLSQLDVQPKPDPSERTAGRT